MKNTREHDKKWIETLQERNRVLNELLQLTQIENEELKEQLTLTDVVVSEAELVCEDCQGYGWIADENGRRKDHCYKCD